MTTYTEISVFSDIFGNTPAPSHALTHEQSWNVLVAWFKYQHNSTTFRVQFLRKVSTVLEWSLLVTVLQHLLVEKNEAIANEKKYLKAFLTLVDEYEEEVDFTNCFTMLYEYGTQQLEQYALKLPRLTHCQKRSFRINHRYVPYARTRKRLLRRRQLETSLAYTRCPLVFSKGMSPRILQKKEEYSYTIYVYNHTLLNNLAQCLEYCALCQPNYLCDFHTMPCSLLPVPNVEFWATLQNTLIKVVDRVTFDGYNRIQSLRFLQNTVMKSVPHSIRAPNGLSQKNLFGRLQNLCSKSEHDEDEKIWTKFIEGFDNPYLPELCIFANVPFGTDTSKILTNTK